MAARKGHGTIDDYIADFPQDVQKILQQIRSIIRDTAPDAEEGISYKIPAFKLNGRYLIYFAGFKSHVSLYPAPRVVAAFQEELAAYKGGKGTIQLPLKQPLPKDLIRRIVEYRVAETARKAKSKKT